MPDDLRDFPQAVGHHAVLRPHDCDVTFDRGVLEAKALEPARRDLVDHRGGGQQRAATVLEDKTLRDGYGSIALERDVGFETVTRSQRFDQHAQTVMGAWQDQWNAAERAHIDRIALQRKIRRRDQADALGQ